jgi:hypothetical protein
MKRMNSRTGTQHSMRAMLLALGIGDYNATMLIQSMFISPRATDPAMPQLIVLTKRIQKTLIGMGAQINVTGYLDEPTAQAIDQIASPEWLDDTWGNLVEDVLAAQRAGMTFPQVAIDTAPTPAPTGGLGDVTDLMPGGILGYAAVGGFLYWYFIHRKKRKAA